LQFYSFQMLKSFQKWHWKDLLERKKIRLEGKKLHTRSTVVLYRFLLCTITYTLYYVLLTVTYTVHSYVTHIHLCIFFCIHFPLTVHRFLKPEAQALNLSSFKKKIKKIEIERKKKTVRPAKFFLPFCQMSNNLFFFKNIFIEKDEQLIFTDISRISNTFIFFFFTLTPCTLPFSILVRR